MARETKLKEDTAARLQKISRVIQSIASGDFSSRLELAPALDEIDSIACGINMLAEELGERFEEKAYIDRRVDAVLESLQKAAAGDLAASADLEEKNDAFDALTAGTNMMIEEVGARIREIEQAKHYLDNIIRSMIDILFVVDAQAKITTVNAAACDVSGYTEEELIGQPVSIIFAEEEEEEEEAFFKGTGLSRLMRDGEVRNMELTILTKSAERIPLVFNGSAIREEDGSLAAVVGVARDMRETMRLIADLRESEERYRYLFENVFDVIFSIDRQLRILNISPSVERTLGYKPEELIGRSFPDLNILSPESLETAVSDTMRVFDGERIALTVYEFIAKDGTRRFGELSVTPLSRDGEVVSAISVARDITDKKLAEEALKRSHDKLEMRVEERTEEIAKINEELRAEITERKRAVEALRESEKRYRTLVETIRHGIQEIDISGVITFANPGHHRIFGCDEGELLGKLMSNFIAGDSARKEIRDYVEILVKEQPTPTPWTGKVLRKDGRVIDVQTDWNYKRDEEGRVTGFVSVIADITERKQAEEELRRLQVRYQTLVDKVPAIIYTSDIEPPYPTTYISPQVEALGFSADEWIDDPECWVKQVHPDDRERILTAASKPWHPGMDTATSIVCWPRMVRCIGSMTNLFCYGTKPDVR